jgi:DNA-binding transcriptional LysR family regulator
VNLSGLADEDLVGFPPEFGLRRLMDGAFHAAGVQPRTQYEVPAGFAAIADLVGNGLGTAFMPSSEARRFSDLRAIELTEQVLWQVYLASPPFHSLTPATARLADALLDAAARARAM